MAAEKDDDLFESTLNDASKQKANDELNERNDEDRRIAVQTLRKWALQQDWLKTPTDFRFLLRFLRARKFSQLGARETLENYWTNRAKKPKWHEDLDPADPKIQEIFRAKIYYSPLKYDKNGCRWLFSPFGNLTQEKVNQFGVNNIFRVMVVFLEWVCFDENVQVNGLRWLIDYSHFSMGVLMKLSKLEDQKYMNHFFQKALPARMKAFYIYNEPTFFDVLYSMFAVFSRKKLLDRIHMVGKNMTTIYEHVNKSMIPDEYLPDDYSGPSAGPESQIIEDMLTDMTKPPFRNYLREVTSSKYGIDLKKRSKEDEPVASFRKLNVE